MNYYEHHLGDYLRDTAHLSMIEDGAYRRLIDAYYIRQQPLPAELRDVYRLVRAGSKQDKEAVDVVLREFFTQTEEGWSHTRCEKEIARFQEKQSKARASANKRWAAVPTDSERNANAMRTHSEGNAPRARPQSPDTNTPSLRSGVARGTRLPPNWEPEPEQWGDACIALKVDGACTELAKFRDYWISQPGQKGVKADWNATWRNWIRKAVEYAESRGHSRQGPAKPTSAVERVREACNLDADGFPLGSDDGDLRPQVDEQLRHEAGGNVVEAPFRVVS